MHSNPNVTLAAFLLLLSICLSSHLVLSHQRETNYSVNNGSGPETNSNGLIIEAPIAGAANITNTADVQSNSNVQASPAAVAGSRCVKGWATVYGPTGERTADGSVYTGSEQGVAVDLDTPVLGTTLGSKLIITNLNNHQSTTQQVRDYGAFGNPREYGTPDGAPRQVDLTYGAAARIEAGDMTPVKVCAP